MGVAGPGPCVFCGIVAGDEVSSRVYEDDWVIAFLDRYPVNLGMTVVIPRSHVVGLMDLDEELAARMWRVGHRLARAMRQAGFRCEGVNLFLADGEAAFQDVFHVHLLVIPRCAGDGLRIDGQQVERDRADLDAAAQSLVRALSALTP